jgi:cyclopropane-fatty-acyl-phospholipid synthase
MLLTKTAMKEQAVRVGLVLEQVETFRHELCRARCGCGRERFLERWSRDQAKMGYDEQFRRKWLYYLSYCEAGFSEGEGRSTSASTNARRRGRRGDGDQG